MQRPIGIKYYSYYEQSGYAEAGRRYLRGLRDSGVPVTWAPLIPAKDAGLWHTPFTGSTTGDSELDPLCNRAITYDTVIAHCVPEHYPRIMQREPGKKIFGCTVWETTAIPNTWPALLNQMDGILVPSNWNKQVFKQCGVHVPIFVYPHIHEQAAPSSAALPIEIPKDNFVFYTIDRWSERKATEHCISAYFKAFTTNDPVTLLLKTSASATNHGSGCFRRIVGKPFQSTRKVLEKINNHQENAPQILLCDKNLSKSQIAALHTRGDCYVALPKGEGWGIGAFDACAFANPVIMTGFGGQIDYLNQDNLVRFTMSEVVDSSPSYTPNQRWAEPDITHAAHMMRQVFENKAEALKKSKLLRSLVAEKFNGEKVTKDLIHNISSLYGA